MTTVEVTPVSTVLFLLKNRQVLCSIITELSHVCGHLSPAKCKIRQHYDIFMKEKRWSSVCIEMFCLCKEKNYEYRGCFATWKLKQTRFVANASHFFSFFDSALWNAKLIRGFCLLTDCKQTGCVQTDVFSVFWHLVFKRFALAMCVQSSLNSSHIEPTHMSRLEIDTFWHHAVLWLKCNRNSAPFQWAKCIVGVLQTRSYLSSLLFGPRHIDK